MAADETCPGPCNKRYREVREVYDAALEGYDPLDPEQSRPEPPDIRPFLGDPWCQKCKSIICAQLAELDELAPLRALDGDGYPADASPAHELGGGSEIASPSPAGDDTEDTYRMLAEWEHVYRDLNGWPSPPRRGILATKRTTCVAWLSEHLDPILTSVIGEDFGHEVMQWHRELKARAKAGKRKLEKPLRCPGCKHLMLTWDEGEKYVQCGHCGLMLTYDEYEGHVETVAASLAKGHAPDFATPVTQAS